ALDAGASAEGLSPDGDPELARFRSAVVHNQRLLAESRAVTQASAPTSPAPSNTASPAARSPNAGRVSHAAEV
ncbi:unnamed protein product, partial [Polarella glacialis]